MVGKRIRICELVVEQRAEAMSVGAICERWFKTKKRR